MDSAYYCDFLGEKLGIPRYYLKGLKITFNRYDGSWEVERSDDVRKYAGIKATEVYGTHRANAFRIFEDCLNQRDNSVSISQILICNSDICNPPKVIFLLSRKRRRRNIRQ